MRQRWASAEIDAHASMNWDLLDALEQDATDLPSTRVMA